MGGGGWDPAAAAVERWMEVIDRDKVSEGLRG